jgi:hypothetical protein
MIIHWRKDIMKKDRYELFNKHHLIPTSKWWLNVEDNILKIPVQIHNAIHLLFQNKRPDEQIKQLLKLNSDVLTEDFKWRIREVIENWKDWTYIRWVYIPKN